AFAPLAAELHPELTTRERVALQTRPQQCTTCHGVINPLGYTLEPFDAIGRYRDQANAKPIDAPRAYETRTAALVPLAGARDLANFLAGSEEVQDAFVEHLFEYLVKQPVRAYGPRTLTNLRHTFAAENYNIRRLEVEIIAASLAQKSEVRDQKSEGG